MKNKFVTIEEESKTFYDNYKSAVNDAENAIWLMKKHKLEEREISIIRLSDNTVVWNSTKDKLDFVLIQGETNETDYSDFKVEDKNGNINKAYYSSFKNALSDAKEKIKYIKEGYIEKCKLSIIKISDNALLWYVDENDIEKET